MGHTPYSGKQEPRTREISSGNENALLVTSTSRAAGVVLRATVETFGPAGDAELHFTVKWPAAALAVAQRNDAAVENHAPEPAEGDDDGYDTEGNIHTQRSTPPDRSKDKPEA
jgi:hypothetical protein